MEMVTSWEGENTGRLKVKNLHACDSSTTAQKVIVANHGPASLKPQCRFHDVLDRMSNDKTAEIKRIYDTGRAELEAEIHNIDAKVAEQSLEEAARTRQREGIAALSWDILAGKSHVMRDILHFDFVFLDGHAQIDGAN